MSRSVWLVAYGIVALIFCGSIVSRVEACGGKNWSAGGPITAEIVLPTDGRCVGDGKTYYCSVAASDPDHWTMGQTSGDEYDGLNVQCSATDRTFPDGSSGICVVWKAPDNVGSVTISCVANDTGGPVVSPDTGERNDAGEVNDSVTVYVVKATITTANEIEDGPHSGTAYIPANNNDSNNNGIIDYRETGADPDDIIEVKVKTEGGHCPFSLSFGCGGDPENPFGRVWLDSARSGSPLTSPIPLQDGEQSFYVEGIIPFRTGPVGPGGPVQLSLSAFYGDPTDQCGDSLTIVPCDVDLDIGPFVADVWGDENLDTAEHGTGTYPDCGTIIPLNTLDEDHDGVPDRDDPPPHYPGPAWTPELTCAWSTTDPPAILSAVSGGDKVRLWASDPVALPMVVSDHPELADLGVEGIQTSGSQGDVRLKIEQTLPGPVHYKVSDEVRITVVQADLSIAGRSESEEEINPRPIAVNDDDDNANTLCDNWTLGDVPMDHPVSGEDELVHMTLDVRPRDVQGWWELLPYSNIRFWTTDEKTAPLPGSAYLGPPPVPIDLYAEAAGAYINTAVTHLSYIPSYASGPYYGNTLPYMRVPANLDSGFGVIRTAISVIANTRVGAQRCRT